MAVLEVVRAGKFRKNLNKGVGVVYTYMYRSVKERSLAEGMRPRHPELSEITSPRHACEARVVLIDYHW